MAGSSSTAGLYRRKYCDLLSGYSLQPYLQQSEEQGNIASSPQSKQFLLHLISYKEMLKYFPPPGPANARTIIVLYIYSVSF